MIGIVNYEKEPTKSHFKGDPGSNPSLGTVWHSKGGMTH